MTDDLLLTNESGLCGAFMIDGMQFPKIIDFVTETDFESPICKDAFAAAYRLYTTGGVIDPITVTAEMTKAGRDDLESRLFARDSMSQECNGDNAVMYALGIRAASKRRRIQNLLSEAMNTESEPDRLINTIIEGLCAIERDKKGRAATIKDTLKSLAQWVSGEKDDGGVNTGYQRLDSILNDMKPGNLILLAGRPASGKSAEAGETALRAAEKGIPTAFFSCEMSKEEIAQRFIASRAKIKMDDMVSRKFKDNPDACRRYSQAQDKLWDLPLYIYEESGLTVADIRRTLQMIGNIGFVVVDYIQLMHSVDKCENRNLEVAKISGGLKQLAKEFRIPILALSQLNRTKDEYDEPGLNALRDSGALEQDADKAVLLWRLDRPEPGKLPRIGVKVAKNRNGKQGTVIMRFDGEFMSFYETDEAYTPKKRNKQYDDDFPWNE